MHYSFCSFAVFSPIGVPLYTFGRIKRRLTSFLDIISVCEKQVFLQTEAEDFSSAFAF